MDDYCLGFFALGLVWTVAYRVVQSRPVALGVGVKLGFLSGVLAGGLLFWRGNPVGGADYVKILAASVSVGAAVSSSAWILLPALDIVSSPFRSAFGWAWDSFRFAWLKARERRHARKLMRIWQEGIRQRQKDEAERLANLPPPETRQQKISRLRKENADAVAELEATLSGLELEAAKEKLRIELVNALAKEIEP